MARRAGTILRAIMLDAGKSAMRSVTSKPSCTGSICWSLRISWMRSCGYFSMKSATARCKMQRAERHRSVHAQQPPHLALQACSREVGLLQLGQDGQTLLVIGQTVLGRGHAAGGAGEKLHPKLLLQLDHVLAQG